MQILHGQILHGEIAVDSVDTGLAAGMSVRFRGVRGALITVTIDHVPASREEAIAMAREAVAELASAHAPIRPAERKAVRPRPRDDSMFRSWALPGS